VSAPRRDNRSWLRWATQRATASGATHAIGGPPIRVAKGARLAGTDPSLLVQRVAFDESIKLFADWLAEGCLQLSWKREDGVLVIDATPVADPGSGTTSHAGPLRRRIFGGDGNPPPFLLHEPPQPTIKDATHGHC
jgi:hypothetical protein